MKRVLWILCFLMVANTMAHAQWYTSKNKMVSAYYGHTDHAVVGDLVIARTPVWWYVKQKMHWYDKGKKGFYCEPPAYGCGHPMYYFYKNGCKWSVVFRYQYKQIIVEY